MTFLLNSTSTGDNEFHIHWAQVSCAISGTSDFQWTCYGFVDGHMGETKLTSMVDLAGDDGLDSESNESDDNSADGDNEALAEDRHADDDGLGDDAYDDPEPTRDPMTNGETYIDEIQEARPYFRKVIEVWMEQCVAHWERVMSRVKASIDSYVSQQTGRVRPVS